MRSLQKEDKETMFSVPFGIQTKITKNFGDTSQREILGNNPPSLQEIAILVSFWNFPLSRFLKTCLG